MEPGVSKESSGAPKDLFTLHFSQRFFLFFFFGLTRICVFNYHGFKCVLMGCKFHIILLKGNCGNFEHFSWHLA